ncbi:restin (Reed-Steinberg cell-expressed intermediate filament-associated protein) [Aphelenchoides avenae]|nr:restin (Reed-Steinberg cell-expressed intermediate filament-associated protein) [Aphelenchus avenae]
MASNAYKQICQFFADEGYATVTVEELRDPKPAMVQCLYEKLVRTIFDLDEKTYTKDVGAVAAQLEAHHHERSFSLIKTVNLVGLLCKDLELFKEGEEFSYGDIISPNRDRTRHVLQQFIQYIEFKRQRALDVRQVYDDAEDKERELDDERFKLEAAKNLADRHRQELDSARRKKAEHMRRCVDLRDKVLKLRTDAQKDEEACKKKLAEYASLEEDMKQTRTDLAKAHDKNRALEANIVRSPDKLSAEINRMEQELQKAVEDCDHYARSAMEFENELKRQEEVEHAIENLHADLQQLEAEWDAQAQLRRETDDAKKKVNEAKTALQQLEEQRQVILVDLEARRKELKLSQNAQLHEQQTYLQQVATIKPAIEELADLERQARGEAGRLRRTIDDKTKAYDQLEVDFDARIEELTQRFLEVKKYMEDRTAEIEEVREIARPVLDRL